MKIIFASDHAGFELKNVLRAYVQDELGYEVEDVGAHEYNPEDDYTDFIGVAAKKVAADPENVRAIILGGSGQGEAMQANRERGVRAAVFYGGAPDVALEIIKLSREHNDANVLSIGARFVDEAAAKEAVTAWLATEKYAEEKYARRRDKMDI